MEDHRTDFQKRVAALSDRAWSAIQIAGGLVLGGASSFFLMGGVQDDSQFMFVIYALVLAVFVPKALEGVCGRSLSRARVTMLIAITAVMIVQLIVVGSRQGFSLT